MILADKIIALRRRNGWSQEELAERLDVSRQSVSKWEGGLSVPDLNKIIAMSALFGVSTDYLLKDSIEEPTPSESSENDDTPPARAVSAEEANRYLAVLGGAAVRIALGVLLCILSPLALLLLGGLADVQAIGMSEGLAAFIGLGALLLLVGIAVMLFVPTGMRLSEFGYLERERISPEYGVRGIVEKRRDAFRQRFVVLVTGGVLLCILSLLPLLLFGAADAADWILILCVGALFVICSVGVALIVYACTVWGGFHRLLQTGDYAVTEKEKRHESSPVETVYWCLVTAVYLGISFLTNAWHRTWIIWVVAGCLCPVLEVVVAAVKGKRK